MRSLRTASRPAYARYAASSFFARSLHLVRSRQPHGADIILLGGYHGENSGDWAMGEALMAQARRSGLPARRLAMRDAPRLAESTRSIIIGGGAVATADALLPVAEAWSKHRFNVTFVGTDFASNLHEFDPMIREMCRAATSIGLRHAGQHDRVLEWTGNKNTYVHSDIAFALSLRETRPRDAQCVAINVLPVFHILEGRSFRPGSPLEALYRRQGSPLVDRIVAVANAYVGFVAELSHSMLKQGRQVMHLPFAPEDDLFARAILPKGVRFRSFTTDLSSHEKIIAGSTFLLPTRFHALIAGMRTRTPFIPLAYAGKAQALLSEFGIPSELVVDRDVLTAGQPGTGTVEISAQALEGARQSAIEAVARAIAEAEPAHR
ncbi:polysaccharide pyruvyl transferase family protein [Acuticoccus sp. I52.16.1]|uniref:polysaccharide pyruvyl transferase family protein n=1 Tax=Acuticoccus sp. I52.16.1 TaxID=2928472 RepID=UPI001FCFBCC4|nr:polysaccharide pyruvyl transferase family protein [Acuticoccus sp. I52.16.1]UOM36760.1 polysaccharide pyruvyl transferase family protein [Acuticoccus sp. I52.16.1]